MINTRETLYTALTQAILDLRMLGNNDSHLFKKILFGIILNDMKEWHEYVADDKLKKINEILTDYLQHCNDFKLCRFIPDDESEYYTNVNVVQNNDDWSRIWDKSYAIEITEAEADDPERQLWIEDDELYSKGIVSDENVSVSDSEVTSEDENLNV